MPLSLKVLRIYFIEKNVYLHDLTFYMISFSIHHCYIKLFLKTLLLCIFMDILYSMFIPARFILCNKLTEMVIVSHALFSVHGNQVSFNQDKLN